MLTQDRLPFALRIASVSLLAVIALELWLIKTELSVNIVTTTKYIAAKNDKERERMMLSIPIISVQSISEPIQIDDPIQVDGSVRVDNLYEIER